MHIIVLSCCHKLHLVLWSGYISTGSWPNLRIFVITELSHLLPSLPHFLLFCYCSWLLMSGLSSSLPPFHCSLLVHYIPLSFLLSHPCSNQPHKQASHTEWLTSERGLARGAQLFTVFSIFTLNAFFIESNCTIHVAACQGPYRLCTFLPSCLCVCVFIRVAI